MAYSLSSFSVIMASETVPLLKPWDADNEEEQCVVLTSPKYKDLLNKKRANLTEVVNLLPLWVYLRQYQVINKTEEETLKVKIFTSNQYDKL